MPENTPPTDLPADRALVELIRQAQRILMFTGAGISTRSGIPDYRGPKGVWKVRKPVYYDEFMSDHDARVEYWDFKLDVWAAFRDAEPNDVHRAVKRLEEAGKLELVVTQNIDGLHSKAGTSDDKLVELHGTDKEVECQSCHARSAPEPHFRSFENTREPPACAACGGWLKPATISFGQSLCAEDLVRAQIAAGRADLVIALGSTLSVYPAAQIPLIAVRNNQARYVIINMGETDHDDLPVVTLRLEGDVSELFAPAVYTACT
jgi:NAD-dependent deacetylase